MEILAHDLQDNDVILNNADFIITNTHANFVEINGVDFTRNQFNEIFTFNNIITIQRNDEIWQCSFDNVLLYDKIKFTPNINGHIVKYLKANELYALFGGKIRVERNCEIYND